MVCTKPKGERNREGLLEETIWTVLNCNKDAKEKVEKSAITEAFLESCKLLGFVGPLNSKKSIGGITMLYTQNQYNIVY